MSIDVSLIIPTRDRGTYLEHSLRTCLANKHPSLEVLVLDNASVDTTRSVVEANTDSRLRYLHSESRLSMRQNFERGLAAARGDIVCFIGDDDGVFPDTVRTVVEMFSQLEVDAISAARAHYFWPDFLTSRKNTALLPRHSGWEIRNSREQLKRVLLDDDYYKLPCVYHGFVRRNVLERIRKRQGGVFFLSNNVDIFSSIAVAMEDLRFAFSRSPLVINGGSGRSNGASHFGGGQAVEKALWKKEDDLGFLAPFADSLTMGSFIVESGLRFIQKSPSTTLAEMFGSTTLCRALKNEAARRLAAGYTTESAERPLRAASLTMGCDGSRHRRISPLARLSRLLRSYEQHLPVMTDTYGVSNVSGAAILLAELRNGHRTGFLCNPVRQLQAALRLAGG